MRAKSVKPQDAIALLNEASKLDRVSIRKLVGYRVFCNFDLADHPTISVDTTESGDPLIGMLGIINGLFGVDDEACGPVIASIPEDSAAPVLFSLNSNFK
jgi:hypothetical protein